MTARPGEGKILNIKVGDREKARETQRPKVLPGGLGEGQSHSCSPFSSATPGDLVFSNSKGTDRAPGMTQLLQVLRWRERGQSQREQSENLGGAGHRNPRVPRQRALRVSPTSACVFQKSASLELFTSQLMTSTSGRQRMFLVCTCRERGRWE